MRAVLVIAVSVLLCGCAMITRLTAPEIEPLTPDDIAMLPTGQTILAIGLTVDDPDQHVKGTVGWVTRQGDGKPEMAELKFPATLRPGQRQLVLWPVPAGRWSLRHARLIKGWFSHPISDVLRPHSATATIAPGSVTYVGDLYIRVQSFKPILDLAYDPTFAAQAVKAYPNLPQPLTTAPLSARPDEEFRKDRPRNH